MIKNLYSISVLLPAQFRADPASTGIGWTRINAKIVESVQAEPKELNEVSGDDCASKRTEIEIGDFVQVHIEPIRIAVSFQVGFIPLEMLNKLAEEGQITLDE